MRMRLNNLPKITTSRIRRLGRGEGSGRGKTAGRGTKGQRARGKIRAGFEGGQLSLIKRLPLYRGRGRNKVYTKSPQLVNLKQLAALPKNTTVNISTLVKYILIDKEDALRYGVKILGDGELKQLLTVSLPTSKAAKVKIEKAGGKVIEDSKLKSESQN